MSPLEIGPTALALFMVMGTATCSSDSLKNARDAGAGGAGGVDAPVDVASAGGSGGTGGGGGADGRPLTPEQQVHFDIINAPAAGGVEDHASTAARALRRLSPVATLRH